jgi:hypothetical protein
MNNLKNNSIKIYLWKALDILGGQGNNITAASSV